jgi:enoyl-CoA hydratase
MEGAEPGAGAGPLRLQQDGALAVLTIDHPPLNLWGPPIWEALTEVSKRLAAEPPRGLLIRAEGKVVSAGVDIANFDGLDPEDSQQRWTEQMEMLYRIEALPCPTVFAAHALTLTAAFELALGCDLLVAARSARFGLVEANVGITAASGGTQRMVARAGLSRALEFVYSADVYDAETLHGWGVVTRLFDDDGFDQAALAYARRLAEGPTLAHAAAKRIARTAAAEGTAAADAAMPGAASSLFGTEDQRAAVADFREHGAGYATRFTGR